MGGSEHVSERFRRLLALYRRPDGGEWGGQDLENTIGGAVTRSYVANPKKGRIESPGLAKLGAISRAMGFPPPLWFEGSQEGTPDGMPVAALEAKTLRSILEKARRMRPKERRLLLGIARQISPGTLSRAAHAQGGGQ